MSHDDKQTKLGRFEHGIVKRKVGQIIGRAGFKTQDRKDLEQELLRRLIKGLKSFDPDVAHRKSFVTTIVERAVANILRDAQAQKRDRRFVCSLQVQLDVSEDGPTELAETIGDREYNRRRCRDPRSAEELALLVADVADVIASLPDELRAVAERMKAQSISSIARGMGIPRTTLNETVRRLRQRFEQAGLRNYV